MQNTYEKSALEQVLGCPGKPPRALAKQFSQPLG
jgi:hypothetical protein